MKMLHTSDWHLGHSLMKFSREAEHRAFFDHLVRLIGERAVDTLVVAGDIFDTGTPSSAARQLYHGCLLQLRDAGLVNLVVTGGNHDSVSVLEESRDVLGRLHIHVFPGAPADPADCVVRLLDRQGEVAGFLCAVPYLRPRDVLQSLPGQEASDRGDRLRQAILDYYRRAYEAALEMRGERSLPVLGSGHLTVVGGRLSESVREIYIGQIGALPLDVFPPFDYLALGHLHRCQPLDPARRVWYSGSPIPMSFDELDKAKAVLLVDFSKQAGVLADPPPVEVIPLPCWQALRTLRGKAEALLTQCRNLAAATHSCWLNLELEGDEPMLAFRQQLDDILRDTALELLCLKRVLQQPASLSAAETGERLEQLQTREVFARLLQQSEIPADEAQALNRLFSEIEEELHENSECPTE